MVSMLVRWPEKWNVGIRAAYCKRHFGCTVDTLLPFTACTAILDMTGHPRGNAAKSGALFLHLKYKEHTIVTLFTRAKRACGHRGEERVVAAFHGVPAP